MSDEDRTYEVGYKKPPAATRFKPGQSGNSKGRPKGSKNFATALLQELNAKVRVSENGKQKTITKRDAVAKQVVNQAAAGNPRAIPILLNEARQFEQSDEGKGGLDGLAREDELVMANIIQRIRESAPAMQEVATDAAALPTDGEGNVPC